MKIRMMMTMNAITPMTIPTIAPTAILLDAVNKIHLSADITLISLLVHTWRHTLLFNASLEDFTSMGKTKMKTTYSDIHQLHAITQHHFTIINHNL